VSPQTTYNDDGPIEVDEFKIGNSDEVYSGNTTMIEVMNRSLNTGIAFIAQKMGARMLYEAYRGFGFGEYTDINFPGEAQGQLEYWTDWEDSELVTRGFGQGFTANVLQVALSFGALANGGYLMRPILVEKIIHPDGTENITLPERKRRVVSEESSQTTRAMLLSAVRNGTGRAARINGYTVLGKTGTSQTYKNGKVQTGIGTTIATFAGLAPMDDPQFVIVVKYDYPKLSQWGSETAAVTFRKITQFLFDYYKIPPDY
jgi:cell division protein FtsI/penicillin-binding protein 2